MNPSTTDSNFVSWFRNSAPYINAFRGKTFVISFDGDAVADALFPHIIQDIALLNSLGIRLVLVHGARPQIDQCLKERDEQIRYVNNLRITDSAALNCVKEAVGRVKIEVEALMSMGLANSPMAGARIRVASGNLVAARPLGVRDGVDFGHTGEVRRIDAETIQRYISDGNIVLLSPLGYSPTGEVFNLSVLDVATSAAIALKAEKLIYLVEAPGLRDKRKRVIRQWSAIEAEQSLTGKGAVFEDDIALTKSAVRVCNNGTRRVHVIDRRVDGALLLELFTRDGIGTLINADLFEGIRQASIDDVGGILELIAPLEAEGILVRRSRELLETEIDRFTVVERDGMIIGCAALYPYAKENLAELACLAVHPNYRDSGRGDALLSFVERLAKKSGTRNIFVLTTQAAHWFIEHGFARAEVSALPMNKQAMYNYQRRSHVYMKSL